MNDLGQAGSGRISACAQISKLVHASTQTRIGSY